MPFDTTAPVVPDVMARFDRSVVDAWIADDPDPATRAELTELLRRGSTDELLERFSGPLQFGTAGLRGEIGAGPHRMNRAVVIRTAAGLADYLLEQAGPDFTVVIGCDARHGSRQFALDTAAVVAAAGGTAMLLPPQRPTPLLAFAVRHLSADAGVMVTASHNPPRDNGYKVYLGGRAVAGAGQGAQIVAPHDAEIAARIAAVPSVAAVPRAESGWQELGEEIADAYRERIVAQVRDSPDAAAIGSSGLRVVLTSMHGVGSADCVRVLKSLGVTELHEVAEQAAPDPDFPTVAFPNPEEPGALDLAIALAGEVDADIIVANDPDADRFSAAIPVPGGFRQLSGDEVGLLLGEQAVVAAAGNPDTAAGPGPVVAASIVSSRGLGAIAAAHGVRFQATLTGFKWISRVPGLVFGYEEALGYCVDPDAVRDKDGISATAKFVLLAAQLKRSGTTIADRLEAMADQYGRFLTAPLTVRLPDISLAVAKLAALRAAPPTEIAGSRVTQCVDLADGSAELPPTDGLLLLTEAGDRVIIRPSGTEPKLKCYLEAVGAKVGGTGAASGAQVRERLTAVRGDVARILGIELPS